MARDVARLTQLWRQLGNTGDLPAGWNGPNGSPDNPNYSGIAKPPTAEEILAAQMDKIKEQVSFLKDFQTNNPLSFDEALARQMAQDKFQPYYQEILSDFVAPLREQSQRSVADQARLMQELTRSEALGQTQIKQDTDQAIETAKNGFAGVGLFGGGTATRALNRTGITGNEKLQDFTAKSQFNQTQLQTEEERRRADLQTQIDQKQRDIFGTGRAYDSQVAQDVEQQRGVAQKQYGTRVLDAVSSRFGSPLVNIPDYLSLG